MIITKESHNSIIRSIKKVCNIVFGSIPPKKICPNLWRSIVYAVIMLGLMYWYGINNNKLVNNFVSFLLVIISIIIGIRMVFSYFFRWNTSNYNITYFFNTTNDRIMTFFCNNHFFNLSVNILE